VTNEILSPRTRVETSDSRKADPPTDKERFEMGKELYVVSLAEKMWAETRVAVRADSMEEAARLALAGARYDNMEEWFIDYGQDLLDDTLLKEVSTTTQDDVASDADQHHLLDDTLTKKVSTTTEDDVDAEVALRLDEAHERAINKWKEGEAWWARWFEENSDYLSELWGEGRV